LDQTSQLVRELLAGYNVDSFYLHGHLQRFAGCQCHAIMAGHWLLLLRLHSWRITVFLLFTFVAKAHMLIPSFLWGFKLLGVDAKISLKG